MFCKFLLMLLNSKLDVADYHLLALNLPLLLSRLKIQHLVKLDLSETAIG